MLVKNSLIVISGPSGAGKGTICKELIKKNLNLYYSISYTTRDCRKKEIPDINYHYIKKNEFLKKIKEKKFLEYANVYGNYYGTLKSKIFEKIKSGYDVILEIDIKGALQIKNKYKNAIFIFVVPPSFEELKNRINIRRRDSENDMQKRIKEAYNELNYITEYDYVVINDIVENSVKKIESIIIAEKCHLSKEKLDLNNFIKE